MAAPLAADRGFGAATGPASRVGAPARSSQAGEKPQAAARRPSRVRTRQARRRIARLQEQLELRDRFGRPLGKNKSSSDIPVRSDEGKAYRRRLYALQRTAQEFNPPNGQAALGHCCHHPAILSDGAGNTRQVANVQVLVDSETGRASFGGLLRCGSVWTCPVCAAKIAQERAELVATMLEAHLQLGPGVSGALFLTLTIRHDLTDRLRDLRTRLVRRAIKELRQSYTWKRLQRRGGYLGDVRALEVTVGPRHGWHPHPHYLLLLDHEPSEEERAQLEQALFHEWKRCCERADLPAPLQWAVLDDGTRKGLGVNLEIVQRGQAGPIGEYMAGGGLVSAAAGAAAETAGFGKLARAGNRTPLELLADVQEKREKRDIRLWQEWAGGMRGARQFEWSRGQWDLRARFGLRVREDDEIAADESEETKTAVNEIGAGVYAFFSRVPGWRPRVLELAEEGGGLAVLEFVERCKRTFRNGREPPPWYQEELWNR